ncbi:MAG: STAS/SEC14 domain-containing protein [Gammaproteobacteria bacterium]|nr:STAS/SEC14 domain-containing protein [Gammaproteobacteria bacterium]
MKKGNAKLLVIVEDFVGWSKTDEWGDISFSERNDPYLYRMAIVGDDKWREFAAMFTMQDLRDVPIEYFLPEQEIPARQWLSE